MTIIRVEDQSEALRDSIASLWRSEAIRSVTELFKSITRDEQVKEDFASVYRAMSDIWKFLQPELNERSPDQGKIDSHMSRLRSCIAEDLVSTVNSMTSCLRGLREKKPDEGLKVDDTNPFVNRLQNGMEVLRNWSQCETYMTRNSPKGPDTLVPDDFQSLSPLWTSLCDVHGGSDGASLDNAGKLGRIAKFYYEVNRLYEQRGFEPLTKSDIGVFTTKFLTSIAAPFRVDPKGGSSQRITSSSTHSNPGGNGAFPRPPQDAS